jgi:hypothetical protein
MLGLLDPGLDTAKLGLLDPALEVGWAESRRLPRTPVAEAKDSWDRQDSQYL